MKLLGRRFQTVEFTLGNLVFRQIRRVLRKPLPAFTAFQVCLVQIYQSIMGAYVELLQSDTVLEKIPMINYVKNQHVENNMNAIED